VGKWTAFNAGSAAWFDLPLYKYMYCRPKPKCRFFVAMDPC
jgi:hypothetical protein